MNPKRAACSAPAPKVPMNASDGWEDDLRQVRLALDKLGAVEPQKGAASLYLDGGVLLDDESHCVEIESVKHPRVHRTFGQSPRGCHPTTHPQLPQR